MNPVKSSLMTRALLLILVTLSLVLSVNTLVLMLGFARDQKDTLLNNTHLIGEHLREQLNRSLDLGMPLEILDGVDEYCGEIVDGNRDIGYCMVVDSDSRVLFHSDPLVAGRILRDEKSMRAANIKQPDEQRWTYDGVEYYDVIIPITDPEGEHLGAIRMGLKADTVSQRVYPLVRTSVVVAFATFLLASGIVIYFVRRKVVEPIIELSANAALITHGDLTRRIEPASDDEVGQLGISFNKMADSLKEREERIQQGYRELEGANKELAESYSRLESTAMELELKSRQLREKLGEMSFLHDATDRLRMSIEMDDILNSVVGDVTAGQGYDRALIALVNEEKGLIEEKAEVGFDEELRESLEVSLTSHNVLSATVSERKVQYVAQATLDSRVPERVADELDLREFAAIPMVGKDRCVGVMLVDNNLSKEPLKKDKLDILVTFAATAAMAIENALLYRQLVDNLETVERANMELRKLDQTKTNFLSLASHELRTPLVSVMGCLNLMLSEDLGEVHNEQRQMLEIALNGATRLRDIIEDLLMVAKIEGGRISIKPRWISIDDVVGASLNEVSVIIGQRNVDIRTEALDRLPKIEADFERLQQCFTNLIGNAVKFTPDGGSVTVSGRKVLLDHVTGKLKPVPFDNSILSANTYVEVTVEDTGIGINKENLDKIFDKFYEAADVDTHSTGKIKFMGGGTGLGLSIVKGIVEAHKGRVWAESEGEDMESLPGTRFRLLLPLKQPAVEEEAPGPEVEAGERSGAEKGDRHAGKGRPKVLLIEDDEDIVTFTRLILEKKYDVVVAADGFEGLKKAFGERPDVVLLDVWMPGIDGFEVCRILKSNAGTSFIRVAMFTAAAQKHEVEKGYKAGADDYITKPFTPAELSKRVEKLINSEASVS